MTAPAITVGPDASLAEAARLLHRHQIKRLPVLDPAGPLVGIVSRADLLKVFLRSDDQIAQEVRQDVLRRDLGADPTPSMWRFAMVSSPSPGSWSAVA